MNTEQRLSMDKLREWEKLGYGMFIHFGMSTFDGMELNPGTTPIEKFYPEKIDVESWIITAKEAGMKYAVLASKHTSGFCLWDSKYTDYNSLNSSVNLDIVDEFIKACDKHNIKSGLYYCSWDNHHSYGSVGHDKLGWDNGYVSREYEEFQLLQIKELLLEYTNINEFWIDIPSMLSRGYKEHIYKVISSMLPDCKILMNRGLNIGLSIDESSFPSDIFAIERITPNGFGWNPLQEFEDKKYYIPCETCETIGLEWFYTEGDYSRSDEEITSMFYLSRCRGSNMLLNVSPNKDGLIPTWQKDSLFMLRDRIISDARRYGLKGDLDDVSSFVPKLTRRGDKSAGVCD